VACVVLAVLRVLVVLVSVQSTGVLHLAADAVDAIADGSQHREGDCDDPDSGRDCPPGCPSCHCTHGMMAAIPVPPGTVSPAQPPAQPDEAHFWSEEQAPPQGALTSVFRPPRRAGLFT
jgi:hypothetical protein